MNKLNQFPNSQYSTEQLARQVHQFLTASKALSENIRFFAVPYPDRLLLAFPLAALRDPLALRSLRPRLSAHLHGRRVTVTLRRGAFVQISWETQMEVQLESLPLDLGKQVSPWHLPLGTTKRGPLWLSLLEMDSLLIGGMRRMGKTSVIHSFIQALVNGGQTTLVLYDGKAGAEFSRYGGLPHVVIAENLSETLLRIYTDLVQERMRQFSQAGVVKWQDWNAKNSGDRMLPLALILDEVASVDGTDQDLLARIVREGGAAGVYPIIGIQRPDAEVMPGQLRANLGTRIALRCATPQDSRIILGRSGAEKLPGAGRLLFEWDGKLVTAQAFRVKLPEPVGIPVQTPLLDSKRAAWVAYAASELNGFFRIREIASQFGVDDGVVNRAAGEWAERGLLTDIQYDKTCQPPKRIGRKITAQLGRLAGVTDLADLPDLGRIKADLDK